MRDGQMSRNGWDALGPNVAPPFAGRSCELAYGDSMFATWPALADSVDHAIRADGVSTELVSRLAPAAKGDAIMMLTIGGKPRPASESGSTITSSMAPSGRVTTGVHAGGDGTPVKRDDQNSDASQFTVSATFFATSRPVREVARIELRYAGTAMSEALTMFRNKLESEFPAAHCSPWNLALAPP